MGDMKLWSSRHCRHRYRRYRPHRRSRSKVEKKIEQWKRQIVSQGKEGRTRCEEGRIIVCSSSLKIVVVVIVRGVMLMSIEK
jgi:hypothetical protein